MATKLVSPDTTGLGLTDEGLDAARYDGASTDPLEPAGLLNGMMPSRVRVLDVGCGTGSISALANKGRGNDVTGVEPDVERAALARSRGLNVHNNLLEGDFQQSLGLFDVVMAVDVLEHTPSPAAFLQTLRRSMKPNGLLLLSVPNVAHWSVRWMLLTGRFEYEATGIMDATHLRWFTEDSLKALLRAEGFKVLEVRHTIGIGLSCYHRKLFRRMPDSLRRKVVVLGTRLFPKLFGVQHIIKSRIAMA